MKKIFLVFSLFIFSSCEKNDKLDFPVFLNEITKVELERPDFKSGGKFAQIKELNKTEIIQLIQALKKAKPIGFIKFKTDFYINIKSKNIIQTDIYHLKVNGNIIKDFESDLAYKIEDLKFLKDF